MNYRAAAAAAARRHGVPPRIFMRQIQQESGFNPNARSPAGAQGIAQFMPGTARGMHVDPMNPIQALDGAARLMGNYIKKYRRVDYALAAYNAGPGAVDSHHGIPPYKETRNYVRSIMGGLGSPGTRTPSLPAFSAHPEQMDVNDSNRQRQRLMAALTPSPEMSQILDRTDSPMLHAATQLAAEPITLPQLPQAPPRGAVAGAPSSVGAAMPMGPSAARYARLAPGADRPGVHTSRDTLAFVARVGQLAGRPLTIGTGTQHSRMTVNNRVSDHWSGHAADIPATGHELIRLGQLALIAAGMPRKQALKQRGGLYNVGGHQVIFNTHMGGDHTNHLHVSAR